MKRRVVLFSEFERIAVIALEAARLLEDMLADVERVPQLSVRIRDLEHQADGEARRVFESLRRDFLPPLDGVSAQRLTSSLDDVVDAIEEVAARLSLYGVGGVPEEARNLGELIRRGCERMFDAVRGLREMHTAEPVLVSCRAIGAHEREADRIHRGFLARLLRDERDVMAVIKWMEIAGLLEDATDRIDDVANVVEGIVIDEA